MAGLEGLLEKSELDSLPKGVKEKVECRLEGERTRFEELEVKYERLKVNSEQQFFELEKEFINCKGQLESETLKCGKLKTEFDQLDQKHKEVTQNLRDTQEKYDAFQTVKDDLERRVTQLTSENFDLSSICDRRAAEISKLSDEWKSLSERCTSLNNAKCEALAKLDELQSQETSFKSREQQLEQERAQMQQQIDWLNSDLKEKTKELIVLRKEQSEKMLDLQTSVDVRTEEANSFKELANSLEKTVDKQAVKIETLAEKLKESREQQAQVEEQYRSEVHAQTKLVTLYKESSEDMEGRISEMTTAVEELQKLIGQAQTANSDLEKQLVDNDNKYQADLKVKDEQIAKFERELSNANTILEQSKRHSLSKSEIEAMSPSAAAVSSLLKSGKTLTQIYSEYVEMSENYEKEKEENRRLNASLDQILLEIEQKAPIMKKQRLDYEHALNTVNQLTRQLDSAMMECERLRISSDDSQRKFGQLSRDNNRLTQQTVDLGLQVRVLLKELEEARGSYVTTAQDESEAQVSSSSQVITRKLVSFRSIEELQEQNQKLLQVVRELSDKQEEEENSAIDSRTAELKSQLESAIKDLESMKYARTKQQEMVESLVRQRDMYRVLLSQTGNLPDTPSKTQSPLKTPSVVGSMAQPDSSSSKELQDAQTALVQLKTEYETYKKERTENTKLLNEQIESVGNEASELRLQNSRLASQLDYSAERYKILQTNNENGKKEIDSLRSKNQKLTVSAVKYEQTINTLRQEIKTSQEYQARSEVRCENLQSELSIVKQSAARLEQEKESMLREKQMQTVVLANLQTIQNNLERSEFETKTLLGNRNEHLEGELRSLRRKHDGDAAQHKAVVQSFQAKIESLHSSLESSGQNTEKVREELVDAYSQLHTTQNELTSTKAKLASAETRLSRIGQPSEPSSSDTSTPVVASSQEELRDTQDQLGAARAEVISLQEQVTKLKEHAEQYKSIAESVERSLHDQNQVSEEFKSTMMSQVEQAKLDAEKSESQLESLKKENQHLLSENIRISEESHALNAELRKQLAKVQNELEEAVQRQEQAIATEQSARKDCEGLVAMAAEAQQKYERELVQHAVDVEMMNKYKTEVQGFTEKLNGITEEKKKAETALNVSKESWTEQEKLLRHECQRWETKAKELGKQNDLLHNQLQELSAQMTSFHQRQDSLNVSFSDESSKTSEQLLEVIKFLRREKDICETKFEAAQAETNRLRHKADQFEGQLNDLTQALNEERERSQVSSSSAAQHAELLRKVENLNILTDSNRMLREENKRMIGQIREFEEKVQKLESDITPLQSRIRDLTANRDALTDEKRLLKEEIERWKKRTNQLIDQANRADPEELKKVKQEKEQLRQSLAQSTEEVSKARAELSRVKNQLSSVQNELTTSKTELTSTKTEEGSLRAQTEKLQKELSSLQADVEAKKADIEEKMKTMNQLRKVGRKYRTQYEVLQKEHDELKAKTASAPPASTVSDEQVKALEEKVATSEQSLMDAVKAKTELESKLTDSINSASSLTEQLQQTQRDLDSSKEAEKAFKTQIEDLEKKQVQSRTILQSAKNKLTSQKAEIDKLVNENKELKERLSGIEQTTKQSTEESGLRESTLVSQHQSQMVKLENELKESREESGRIQENLDRVQRENTELQHRVSQLQKLMESSQQGATKAVTVDRPGQGTQEPPTANIRPMATPAAVSRQGVPSAQHVATSGGSRVMGRIRPIAKTPVTSPPSSTPTATVLPTQQEIHEEIQVVVPPNTVRPTQQVQPVSPRVEEAGEGVTPVVEQPSTSQAAEPPVDVQPGSKRQREEMTDVAETEEEADDKPEMKKTRIETQEEQRSPQPEEGAQQGESQQQSLEGISTTQEDKAMTDAEPAGSQETSEMSDLAISQVQTLEPSTLTGILAEETGETPGGQADEGGGYDDDDDDVIVVESGDEEEEEEEDDDSQGYDNDDDRQEEEFEGVTEYMDPDDANYEEVDDPETDGDQYTQAYSQEESMEDEEEEPTADDDGDDDDDDEDDDDDDIIVVEETGPEETAEVSQASVVSVPSMSHLQPVQSRLERLPSVGRPGLTPFALANQAGAFEEGDDGIVPSTPTLFLPRRSDGFAEAVSSPMVGHASGFFGSSESHPELAQLASQGAMGMDDTRMDLSQFDEGTGRSVPTTPLLPTPPITITPPPVGQQLQQQETEPSESAAPDAGLAPGDTETQENTQEGATAEHEGEVTESQELLEGDGDMEEVLEGEQGEEDLEHGEDIAAEEESSDQAPEEGAEPKQEEEEPSTSDMGSGGQTDTQTTSKPKIQRITWSTGDDTSQPQTIQTVAPRRGGPLPPQPLPRGSGVVRGRGQHYRGGPPGQQHSRGQMYRRGGAQMARRGLPFPPQQGRGMRGGRVMRGQRPPY